MEAYGEVAVGVSSAGLFEGRPDQVLEGSGLHRGAQYDGVMGNLAAQSGTDLGHHAPDGAKILATVRAGGRADADEGHLRIVNRGGNIVRHLHAAGGHHRLHQLLDALFHDRRAARADHVELVGIDVHTDDMMAVACQARERDGAYISETEHTDSHLAYLHKDHLFASPIVTVLRVRVPPGQRHDARERRR